MTSHSEQQGFTITELMVTLFVAALFTISGWQLYTVVTQRAIEAQRTSEASNIGYKVLRKHGTYGATMASCGASSDNVPISEDIPTLFTGSNIPDDNREVKLVRCNPVDGLPVNRLTVTVSYGTGDNKQEVSHALYVAG